MTRLRRRAVALILPVSLALVATAPVSSARASDASIKRVLKTYVAKLLVDEVQVATALKEFEKTGKTGKIDAAISRSIAGWKGLGTKIAKQKASTAKGKKAKAKLERAPKRIANAYKTLKVALGLKHSHVKKALKEAHKAERATNKARKELEEAEALLK